MDLDNFIADASAHGITLEGYIAFDVTSKDVILFSKSPTENPFFPIHKEYIYDIIKQEEFSYISDHKSGLLLKKWKASIMLKPANTKEGIFFESLMIIEKTSTTSDNLLGTISYTVKVNCPNCNCELARYSRTEENSSRIYVGASVTLSYSGSCYNKGSCGSGRFCWRGTATSGKIVSIP